MPVFDGLSRAANFKLRHYPPRRHLGRVAVAGAADLRQALQRLDGVLLGVLADLIKRNHCSVFGVQSRKLGLQAIQLGFERGRRHILGAWLIDLQLYVLPVHAQVLAKQCPGCHAAACRAVLLALGLGQPSTSAGEVRCDETRPVTCCARLQ